MSSSTSAAGAVSCLAHDELIDKGSTFYYDQFKHMYVNGMYTSVLALAGWILPLSKSKDNVLNALELCHVNLMCGDSAQKSQEFYQAEPYYRSSLELYKGLVKAQPILKHRLIEHCGTTTDIKYKIAVVLSQCKKPSDALKMLLTIPVKQRTAQINMLMGNLYKETGVERAAVTYYKEVLRVCPLALDAVEQLLLLGCSEEDIQTLVRDKTGKEMPYNDWFNSWVKGTGSVVTRDNAGGIKIFQELKEKMELGSCAPLLRSIGMATTNYGDYQSGIEAFKLVHHIDPMNLRMMDVYAFLLWQEDKVFELGKLMSKINETCLNETRAEPWTISAFYALASNRCSRASIFAARGVSISSVKSSELLIVQGHIHLKFRKFSDAIDCFREVMAKNPERYEAHRGIVECYITTNRIRDAITAAIGALKSVGYTPRIYNLCAYALKQDAMTTSKAKIYLEKSLELDNTFVPAIMNFIEILESEGRWNDAVQMLLNYIELRVSPSKLHARLAKVYSKNGLEDSAGEHFAIALRLDPNNADAKDGLTRLDPPVTSHSLNEVEMDLDVDDEEQDEEVDHGDSELDATIWDEYGLNESR